MGSFSHAFWFWFFALVSKAISAFFRAIWKFNLWILQTISGVPLYYCRPQFRIPAIFIGTIGVMASIMFLGFLFAMGSGSGNNMSQQGISVSNLSFTFFLGIVPLILCRLLIRRVSI